MSIKSIAADLEKNPTTVSREIKKYSSEVATGHPGYPFNECKNTYQNLEKLYTKTTVSELKAAAMAEKDEAAFHAFEEREVVPYIPSFRRDKEEVSGTVLFAKIRHTCAS